MNPGFRLEGPVSLTGLDDGSFTNFYMKLLFKVCLLLANEKRISLNTNKHKMLGLTLLQMLLSFLSGIFVGFSLGFIGGGGSILAIPLLLYFVGFDHPHLAIGTTALAVGINAYLNLIPHARKHNVAFKAGALFSVPGVVGALIGAQLGLITNGKDLLFAFAILMIAVAVYMLRRKCINIAVEPNSRINMTKVIGIGFAVGLASGFFGIGGGFLIVPGLIYSAGLNILQAIGTSLVAVGSFGVVTALRYAISGKLDIIISVLFVLGGILGGWLGAYATSRLPKRTLTKIFAIVIILVAVYMLLQNMPAI